MNLTKAFYPTIPDLTSHLIAPKTGCHISTLRRPLNTSIAIHPMGTDISYRNIKNVSQPL